MVDDTKKRLQQGIEKFRRRFGDQPAAGLEVALPTETLLARVRGKAGAPFRKHSNGHFYKSRLNASVSSSDFIFLKYSGLSEISGWNPLFFLPHVADAGDLPSDFILLPAFLTQLSCRSQTP